MLVCNKYQAVSTKLFQRVQLKSLCDQKPTKHWKLCIRNYVAKKILPSINPLMGVQSFTKEKLIREEDNIFMPTTKEVEQAEKIFIPRKFHEIKFVKGAYYPYQAPDYELPEIAFIGHSNVGKSSLIQSLFGKVVDLEVRTSGKPGHTKLLLFYQCGNYFSLVDMPGYGYNQPENFVTSAEGYISSRKNLQLTFMLVDSNIGLRPEDFVAMEMFEEFAKPYAMIMTKADKASKRDLVSSVTATVKTIREKTQCCLPQPLLVSALTDLGLPFLQCFIAYTTGCLDVKGNVR
ncbi:GTP-binding protein 8-like [Amphiura filiformis]|uniref:GTP-binding protein 8-like n=1 Tax=Amphiura filiformis TaxID=82378 RepID=UPI003B2218F3